MQRRRHFSIEPPPHVFSGLSSVSLALSSIPPPRAFVFSVVLVLFCRLAHDRLPWGSGCTLRGRVMLCSSCVLLTAAACSLASRFLWLLLPRSRLPFCCVCLPLSGAFLNLGR